MRVVRLPRLSRRVLFAAAVPAAAALVATAFVSPPIADAARPQATVTRTVTATVTATVTQPAQTVTVTAPPQTVTVTASPTTVLTTTTTSPTSSATTTPAGLKRTPVDGGPGFFSRFTNPLPTDPTFFPVGVWLEGVQSQGDVDLDKAAGLNTYVGLTDNSNVSLVAASGMNVITNNLATLGAKKNGHLLDDEVDMRYGPGAGYDVMAQHNASLPADGKVRYANYGKGVVFWESDAEAARFANEFQDFTSTDVYWYADDDVCIASQGGFMLTGQWRDLTAAECHRASNYGAQVEKVRRLAGYDTPIWQYVELGHAMSSGNTITAPQVRAAVWSSLIHGARGIVYFNHSFGGACISQHILRDPCYAGIRQEVTALNAQVKRLAPALNSDTITGATTVTGPVDAVTKFAGGKFHVFAGAQTAAGGTATFSLPCVGDATVTVLDEGRTLNAPGGTFTDSFANGEAYHLYQVNGGSCGLS